MLTTDVQVAQRKAGFRPDIQGIRGMAVVAVVVFHADLPVPGGFIGVDVFFVISGYVITQLLLRNLERFSRPQLSQFYSRRARRLMPALALMLTVVMLASILLLPIEGQGAAARTGFAATLLNANTYLIVFGGTGYFEAGLDINPLLHTWSLSVEEQFYLVFPLIVLAGWLMGRKRGLTRRLLPAQLLLLLLGAFSIVLALILSRSLDQDLGLEGLLQRFNFFGPFTRAWEFIAGGLLAMAPVKPLQSRAMSTWLGLCGLALIIVSVIAITPSTPHPGAVTLLPVLGTVLLIRAGTTSRPGRITNLLSGSVPVFLGNISYSWYLWHWPIIVFATILWPGSLLVSISAALASILIAIASTRWVEAPIRFRPWPTRRYTLIIIAACVLVPLFAAVALEGVHREIRGNSDINPFAMHDDLKRRCATAESWAGAPAQCTWRVTNPKGLAVLIGDSNAGQFTEGFVSGMNDAGFDASVATLSSCPFIDPTAGQVNPSMGISVAAPCETFVERSLAELEAAKPAIVIISSSADGYVGSLLTNTGTAAAAAVSSKSDQWTSGLHQAISRLEDAGSKVYVVQPIPKFQDWRPPIFEPAFQQLLSVGIQPALRSRQEALLRRLPAVRAQERAVLGTDAEIIDFFELVCPEAICRARAESRWSHRDEAHISVAMSQELSPEFKSVGNSYQPRRTP